MKHLLNLLLVPFFLILLIFSAAVWWSISSQNPSSDSTLHPFVIAKGENASSIASQLEKKGFIRSALAFKIYVQFTGKTKMIQAGDYRLSKNKNLVKLVGELTRGPIAVWVVLPEGLRKEEMAVKIASELKANQQEQQTFLSEFNTLTQNKEGFLFPDTYLLLKNADTSAIVTKLSDTFDKKVSDDIFTQAKNQRLSQMQLITLASLVERETKTDEERPIVAGILLKRLKAGWPLQVDATLQYARANIYCKLTESINTFTSCDWWKPITPEQRTLNSPYNTYTNRGLPPNPIANPGLSSIKAVASPQNSPYWFYLHDSQGNIHYATTAEEHAKNIQMYLK